MTSAISAAEEAAYKFAPSHRRTGKVDGQDADSATGFDSNASPHKATLDRLVMDGYLSPAPAYIPLRSIDESEASGNEPERRDPKAIIKAYGQTAAVNASERSES